MVIAVVQWLGVLYGALLGACVASFGCVVSERLPAGGGLGGRSRCACGRQLGAAENVPVLGWLRCRGRARCCGAVLPVRYLAWECGYGLWGAVVAGWAWHAWTGGHLGGAGAAGAAAAFLALAPVLLVATWQRPGR